MSTSTLVESGDPVTHLLCVRDTAGRHRVDASLDPSKSKEEEEQTILFLKHVNTSPLLRKRSKDKKSCSCCLGVVAVRVVIGRTCVCTCLDGVVATHSAPIRRDDDDYGKHTCVCVCVGMANLLIHPQRSFKTSCCHFPVFLNSPTYIPHSARLTYYTHRSFKACVCEISLPPYHRASWFGRLVLPLPTYRYVMYSRCCHYVLFIPFRNPTLAACYSLCNATHSVSLAAAPRLPFSIL